MRTLSPPSSAVVSSTMTTASAPGGSGAPVMMRTAQPGSTGMEGGRARGDRARHPEHHRRPLGVRHPHGEPVDGGVLERRDVFGHAQILSRHVPERLPQRDGHDG